MKKTEKISALRAGVELRQLVGKYSGNPITNTLNLIVQRIDVDSNPTVLIKTCRKALAEAMQIVRRTKLKKGPVGPSFDDSINRLEK
ncbi:MAG TPA: hypothetical protein VM577_02590, partial [Anaerovoracaceae bacterium]|nr:hypothetical protein [Anaerovoracaceae bacterium]